ncbi:MAG: epoxyqueuosine reductase QueH [Bacteroidaceae bacterium]|nr:epoxyqueuosine reductase QueH [Bacteroidaceae bacterium]
MLKLEVPHGESKVLLHSCCAPCSSAIIECMVANGLRPTVYYYNPNIYPKEEYETRKAEAKRFVTMQGLNFVDADYDYGQWKEGICGLEEEPERGKRCLQCFKLRLLHTAQYAATHDFTVITTTLASSRWKSLQQINEAGQWAAAQVEGVTFWEQNWRKGGLQERRNELLKAYNFYNQQYCGCEFSLNSRLKQLHLQKDTKTTKL